MNNTSAVIAFENLLISMREIEHYMRCREILFGEEEYYN